MMPPLTTHKQQHALRKLTSGSADSTPATSPPMSAGWTSRLIVVLPAKVSDEFLTLEIAQRVLQLHQLDEEIVFGIEAGRVHGALEVERQPLLNPVHARPLREIEEKRDVEHDRRGENAVAAQEVDLQLHRVAEPPDQVDVVPAFLVVAARRIVVDPHDVAEVLVEVRVELRLKDVIENRLLALFLRLE